MKDERIYNDLKIIWSIKHNDTPFSLEGKNVSMYLHTPSNRVKIKDFTVEDNKVKWTYFGKDQKNTGKHSLELVINEGEEGMITTDYCNFVNLVACSCKVGGTSEPNVEIETIELTSNIEYIAGEGGASYDDTEVRNELSRLEREKADKTKLTELSAEVSKLEKQVPSVFEAIYNTTTYDEIVEAFNAKKHVLCIWNDRVYNLSNIDESRNTINFACIVSGVAYLAYIANGVWGNRQDNFEVVRNITQTISEASAPHQYPSAKAVYDFVNNTLGTLINGEY